jgi:hypothetical protein
MPEKTSNVAVVWAFVFPYIRCMSIKNDEMKADLPLAVDFDGTMQLTDVTKALLVWVARKFPHKLAGLMWLYGRQGRAALKLKLEELAEAHGFVPDLPWEDTVLGRMVEEKAKGRDVVIVTGSTAKLVKRIVEAKGLDYEVVGTADRAINLTGPRKAAYLTERWGHKGFDYVGNSKDDFAVWAASRYALVRGSSRKIRAGARAATEVVWEVDDVKKARLRRLRDLWHRRGKRP